MDKQERFPDFFIIGVPKAGTTSLVNYLNHHPKIFTPQIKEPDAFIYKRINGDFIGDADLNGKRGPMTQKQYLNIFQNPKNATAIGESSFYLYSKNALHNLAELTPNAKFILILRNPAERAFSNFVHMRRKGLENNRDFRKALQNELKLAEADQVFSLNYRRNGLYTRHVKEYFNTFHRKQFLILLYEDWKRENKKYLKQIFTFLGVNPNIEIDTSTKHNQASEAIFPALNFFLYNQTPMRKLIKPISKKLFSKSFRDNAWRALTKLNRTVSFQFELDLRKELLEYYRDDIFKLQELINMDLSHWLESNK